jgi:hypothetical protein
MAKAKAATPQQHVASEITRPGVHSKTKMSHSKNADKYQKRYRGQGR